MKLFTRAACLLALFGALQAPTHAQSLEPRPDLHAFQGLLAENSENHPTPDSIVSTQFGAAIARQGNTALIQEAGFPNGGSGAPGRVAVFARSANGQWVRNGSIDPPRGVANFGARIAVFNDFALFQSSDGAGAIFYRRTQGKWKLVQLLAPQDNYRFTEVALTNGWAFIGAVSANVGAVYVYQITSTGILKGVQTLRSYSGNPADAFGEHVAVADGRVVVSAAGDSNGRGAAYFYELSGALFVKRQKLIAINGAPGERFANSVGISQDWIAVGAPNVQGGPVANCLPRHTTGAIYTFRRIGGTWLQQEALGADGARSPSRECISQWGAGLVFSGKWLVGTVAFENERGDTVMPLVYVRDAGHYAPVAWATVSGSSQLAMHLADSTLFVGTSIEEGCIFEACIGQAGVFNLNDAPPPP